MRAIRARRVRDCRRRDACEKAEAGPDLPPCRRSRAVAPRLEQLRHWRGSVHGSGSAQSAARQPPPCERGTSGHALRWSHTSGSSFQTGSPADERHRAMTPSIASSSIPSVPSRGRIRRVAAQPLRSAHCVPELRRTLLTGSAKRAYEEPRPPERAARARDSHARCEQSAGSTLRWQSSATRVERDLAATSIDRGAESQPSTTRH